jgi:hypothetical protein
MLDLETQVHLSDALRFLREGIEVEEDWQRRYLCVRCLSLGWQSSGGRAAERLTIGRAGKPAHYEPVLLAMKEESLLLP